jgi:hypothetical protein
LFIKQAFEVGAYTAADISFYQAHTPAQASRGYFAARLDHRREIEVDQHDFVGGAGKLSQGHFGTGARTQDKDSWRCFRLALAQTIEHEGGRHLEMTRALLAQQLSSLRSLGLDIVNGQGIDTHRAYLPV